MLTISFSFPGSVERAIPCRRFSSQATSSSSRTRSSAISTSIREWIFEYASPSAYLLANRGKRMTMNCASESPSASCSTLVLHKMYIFVRQVLHLLVFLANPNSLAIFLLLSFKHFLLHLSLLLFFPHKLVKLVFIELFH